MPLINFISNYIFLPSQNFYDKDIGEMNSPLSEGKWGIVGFV